MEVNVINIYMQGIFFLSNMVLHLHKIRTYLNVINLDCIMLQSQYSYKID